MQETWVWSVQNLDPGTFQILLIRTLTNLAFKLFPIFQFLFYLSFGSQHLKLGLLHQSWNHSCSLFASNLIYLSSPGYDLPLIDPHQDMLR